MTVCFEASGCQAGSTPGFELRNRQSSTHDCITLDCTEPFIITPSSSRYDLNDIDRCKTLYHHQQPVHFTAHQVPSEKGSALKVKN